MWVLKMATMTFGVFVAVLIAELVIWSVTHKNTALGFDAGTAMLRGQGLFFAMVGAWFFIFSTVFRIVIPKVIKFMTT
jgi:hypothetical protein